MKKHKLAEYLMTQEMSSRSPTSTMSLGRQGSSELHSMIQPLRGSVFYGLTNMGIGPPTISGWLFLGTVQMYKDKNDVDGQCARLGGLLKDKIMIDSGNLPGKAEFRGLN